MDGIIADCCDGDVYTNHPLFSSDPKAIQIFLYYDDVEVVNPLGSKTSKHKFGTSNQLFFLKKILCSPMKLSVVWFVSALTFIAVTLPIELCCLFVCKEIRSVKSS